ncbi:MAG TPA: 2TM domain-containing protein [Caldimonas sp.]|nr:2TM domain-containing protein [Caldimonas sp.]
MSDDDSTTLEARARRRVARKMGFYVHALVYACVNGGLWLVNTATGEPRWAMWPALGWGIGLAAHGIATFASLKGEGLRQRMVAQEVERLRRREAP